MLTRAQQLRFSIMLRCGAAGCFTRDFLAELFIPKSEYASSRREAKATRSPLIRAVMVPNAERSLEAQLVMPKQPRALVLICHGIGERLYFWTQAQLLLAENNIGSLVFHYAGYGKSRGPFTPDAVNADTAAAHSYLAALAPGVPVFVFGTSLGTAVAIHAAPTLQPPPAGLILSQGFSTVREAAKSVLAKLRLPLGFIANILPDTWRSTETLAASRCPVLVIHSPDDELFALSMGEALYAVAASRTNTRQSIATPVGFSHNVSLRTQQDYWSPIIDFILAEAAHFTKNADPATITPTAANTSAAITYR